MLSIRRADLLLGGYTAPGKPSFITFKTERGAVPERLGT